MRRSRSPFDRPRRVDRALPPAPAKNAIPCPLRPFCPGRPPCPKRSAGQTGFPTPWKLNLMNLIQARRPHREQDRPRKWRMASVGLSTSSTSAEVDDRRMGAVGIVRISPEPSTSEPAPGGRRASPRRLPAAAESAISPGSCLSSTSSTCSPSRPPGSATNGSSRIRRTHQLPHRRKLPADPAQSPVPAACQRGAAAHRRTQFWRG